MRVRLSFNFTLSAEADKMLDHLANVHGSSRSAMIERLIREETDRTFLLLRTQQRAQREEPNG